MLYLELVNINILTMAMLADSKAATSPEINTIFKQDWMEGLLLEFALWSIGIVRCPLQEQNAYNGVFKCYNAEHTK